MFVAGALLLRRQSVLRNIYGEETERLFGNAMHSDAEVAALHEAIEQFWLSSRDHGRLAPGSFKNKLQTDVYQFYARRLGDDLAQDELGPDLARSMRKHRPELEFVDELVSPLISPEITSKPLRVQLRLRSINQQRYKLRMSTVTSHERANAIALAFTSNATLSNVITAQCPGITDVFAFSDQAGQETQVAEYLEKPSVVYVSGRLNRHDPPRRVPLQLRRSTSTERIQKLGPDLAQNGHVTVLVADLPNGMTVNSFEVTMESVMRLDDHYCYWLADRTQYVDRIEIDVSHFKPAADDRLSLRPCLPTLGQVISLNDGVYLFDVGTWLMRGQGVVLVWG